MREQRFNAITRQQLDPDIDAHEAAAWVETDADDVEWLVLSQDEHSYSDGEITLRASEARRLAELIRIWLGE